LDEAEVRACGVEAVFPKPLAIGAFIGALVGSIKRG